MGEPAILRLVSARQTPRARFLGAELRAARRAQNVSVRQLATRLGHGSHSRVSQWETGKKIPEPEDVAAYLVSVGVTGDKYEELLKMTRDAKQSDWLLAGPGMSVALSALMEFERTARDIFVWSPLVLPGLVQTGDYARVTVGKIPMADTKVKIRLGRRDILTRRNPVHFTAVVRESVLHDGIAPPDVMVAQLAFLRELAALHNVTIRVIPEHTAYHPGYMGMFMTFAFDIGDPIVHLEHHRSSAFVDNELDVAEYTKLGEQLKETALSPQDSLTLIANIEEIWRSQT